MKLFDAVDPREIDRRELQLTVFACSAIGVLAAGMAALMYPLVFLGEAPNNRTLRIAFLGFCVLCALLAGYVWDRQKTIRLLRREMAEERRRIVETQRQASAELLKSMPSLRSFQDRLAMEFRRSVTAEKALSILVAVIAIPPDSATVMDRSVMLGDAAKVFSRKLRGEDSVYLLGAGCFGAVLPGVEVGVARRVSARVSEGLADAAGASHRFAFQVTIVNYPVDARTSHELAGLVQAIIPEEGSLQGLTEALA